MVLCNLVFALGGFRAALITNDYHIYRFVSLADSLGISVNSIGVPIPWVNWPLNYLRDMLAESDFKSK